MFISFGKQFKPTAKSVTPTANRVIRESAIIEFHVNLHEKCLLVHESNNFGTMIAMFFSSNLT